MHDVWSKLARDPGERHERLDISDRRDLTSELGHSPERQALAEAAELEHAPLGRRLGAGRQKCFETLRVEPCGEQGRVDRGPADVQSRNDP